MVFVQASYVSHPLYSLNPYNNTKFGIRRPVRTADKLNTFMCRCLEIWEHLPPQTLRVCPGLQWDCFTFYMRNCSELP